MPSEIGRLDRLIVVEVNKADTVMAKDIAKAAGSHQVFDIATVAGTLGHNNFSGSLALAQFNGGRNDMGMRIDDPIAMVFDQIGL